MGTERTGGGKERFGSACSDEKFIAALPAQFHLFWFVVKSVIDIFGELTEKYGSNSTERDVG